LLERSGYESSRIGETLPPAVRAPLVELGVWDLFLADGHAPSPGILVAWGGPEPVANDFILDPYGSGWHVDRRRFDAMLAEAAESAGATVLRQTRAVGCAREGGVWRVSTESGVEVAAGVVVDATGRASPLRRHLGGTRILDDRLVALVGFVPAGEDARTLIEATEHGWWYSAALPDGRMVAAFHTDARPGLEGEWDRFLAVARHTAARVGRAAPAGVRRVAAGSRRREPVATSTWLAVGDAAAAHDPICGLGVHWALESGSSSARAILGETDLDAHVAEARRRFERYLVTRTEHYRAEARWPDAPFWRARRG
jgi:flavin-dependent dehydrogenase